MASTTASEPSPSPSPQLNPSTDIDVSGITTLVSWDLADSTIEYLQCVRGGSSSSICRPKLHIHYESASRSALFKLQLSVLLKSRRNKSKNTAQFFFFITPENINTLSLAAASGQAPLETARNVLSTDMVCLRFDLSAPPTVVAPPTPDRIVPKNERSAGVLASLLDLARQTKIAIYLPHRALDHARLRTLCTAASSTGLVSIDHYDIATLYGGQGGRTLEASIIDASPKNDAADAAGLPTADSPPSYDELGPGPPSAVTTSFVKGSSAEPSSRKRLRRSSSDAGSRSPSPSFSREETVKQPRDGPSPQETLHDVDDMGKQTQNDQMRQQMAQLEQRLSARLDRRLDLFEQLVKEQIQEHKRNVDEMVEQRLEAHEEQTQTDLDQLRREVESDVEDQLVGKKAELHEQFKDEREDFQASIEERFADLEESITDKFSSARAVLEF